MAVTLIGDKAMNTRISHLPGVVAAVYAHGHDIFTEASRRRMEHWYEGEAEVRIDQGDVDTYITLVDEAAFAIEFGHKNARTGNRVEGLYIILGAAGLA